MIGGPLAARNALGGVIAQSARRASVWTPNSIPGLYSWYRFDTLGLANGVKVASAPDDSPNAHTISQGTEADKPTYGTNQLNGLGAIAYNNTGVLLSGSGWDSVTQTRGLFAGVIWFANYLGQQGAFYAGNGTAYAAVLQAYYGTLTMQFNGVSANTNSGPGAWGVYLGYYDGSRSRLRLNGTQLVESSVSAQAGRAVTTIQIGANPAQSYKFEGKTAEILYYAREDNFTLDEITTIEAYLKAKWATP